MDRLLKKGQACLEKHQLKILILHMVCLAAAMVFISRNIAVDWDEAYTIKLVTKQSFMEMIHTTALDIHPPLYYVLLRIYCVLFGTSFFALKNFSVLFTVLTMVLGVTLVRNNWGWKAAFLWNTVIGLGPQFLFYSVNIRMYSLSLFFVVLSALLAYEILLHNKPAAWVLFVISSLGGVYTHYFTAIPLMLIYGYLFIGLIISNKRACKYFLLSCILTIVCYLPWLSVVINSFQKEGTTGAIDVEVLDYGELLEWISSTNIEYSDYMPGFLFAVGIILLVLTWKKYALQERLFLVMCSTNVFLTYTIARLLASTNQHFWDNRYVFAAVALFWMFMSIIYAKQGWKTFAAYTIWLTVMALSSFTIQKQTELGTVQYMKDTYKVLEQIKDEKYIIYNYPTYDVLYSAHLPEQEFVWYEEADFEQFNQDYVYMIEWGGGWFPQEVIQKYNIQVEHCGVMRFEQGVADVKLYKLKFDAQ